MKILGLKEKISGSIGIIAEREPSNFPKRKLKYWGSDTDDILYGNFFGVKYPDIILISFVNLINVLLIYFGLRYKNIFPTDKLIGSLTILFFYILI